MIRVRKSIRPVPLTLRILQCMTDAVGTNPDQAIVVLKIQASG
jgi:hypothetical protein